MLAVFYLLSALPYVIAALLGLLLPVLALQCYSRPAAGIGLVLLIFSAEALYMHLGGLQLGLSIYYTDFVLVFIAGVAILRHLLASDAPPMPRAWVVYGLVFLFSLATGLVSHGSAAGVQARGYFYSIAAATYVISFPLTARHLRGLFDALAAIAVMLVLICVYRWTVYYLPIRELLPEGGTYNVDGAIRVIRSHETLLLAQMLVVGLFFAAASKGAAMARVLSPVLLAAVITLQHRSVWVALLAGILASLLVARSKSGSRASQVLLLCAVVPATALPLAISDRAGELGGQVAASAGNALAGRGTAGERLESWTEIVKKWAAAGPRSIVVGQSFGTDNSRYVQAGEQGGVKKIDYIAHNHYVQTLFNFGLVGLGAFLAAVAFVLSGLYRLCASDRGGPAAEALLVMVVMQLVYYVPYGTDYLQHLIFGVALAFVIAQRADGTPKVAAIRTPRKSWGLT